MNKLIKGKKCKSCKGKITKKEVARIAETILGEVYLCKNCFIKGIRFIS